MASSQKTEVLIGYSDTALYIGVIAHDDNPAGIIVTDSRRDSSLNDTDAFIVIIDGLLDRQNGFMFGTNAAGIEYDAQITKEGSGDFGSGGGAIYVGRDGDGSFLTPEDDDYNRSYAIDGAWGIGDSVLLKVWAAKSAKTSIPRSASSPEAITARSVAAYCDAFAPTIFGACWSYDRISPTRAIGSPMASRRAVSCTSTITLNSAPAQNSTPA